LILIATKKTVMPIHMRPYEHTQPYVYRLGWCVESIVVDRYTMKKVRALVFAVLIVMGQAQKETPKETGNVKNALNN
jgi:hypothetical protein